MSVFTKKKREAALIKKNTVYSDESKSNKETKNGGHKRVGSLYYTSEIS